MSSIEDQSARLLEEFLASADLSDLRSLLRMLGDAGGSDDRVLHLVGELCGTHPVRLADAARL